MIPLDKIVVGENPRGAIDQTLEPFMELCASIEARGVLQSILVGPADGDGKHTVIAGHRRFAAAQKVKLAEIPAMVVDAEGAELTLALIENVQREDLTPVAEARAIRQLRERHGFTQVQAAEALNKSERWARDRERLADLPEKAQEAFDAGAIPLEAAPEIAKVAEKAPKAAEALAELVQRDDVGNEFGEPFNLARDGEIDFAFSTLEDEGVDVGCMVSGYSSVGLIDVKRAGLQGEKLAELEELYKRLESVNRSRQHVHLTANDIDAARAFGCLVELTGEFRQGAYITDAGFLADRVKQHLEEAIAEEEKCAKAGKPDTSPGKDVSDETLKAERRREREEEALRREEGRRNNLELGQRAEKALRAPKLSLEEAQLLALMAVGDCAPDIGARGLIYCYHDYQDEEKLNNGKTKVTYKGGRDAGQDLRQAILGAKKPEEVLGIAVRSILLAHFADQEVVAPSNRSWWSLPNAGLGREGLTPLVEQIAGKRSVLPEAVQKTVEAKRQLEAEEAELTVLAVVKASRAKAGATRTGILATWRTTEAALDQAVDAKRLKEHEGDEVITYTLTAAGKKRLEKLKAAEKERQAAK
jgi:ParB/RepB/Spo0J family partition protein